jgi:hypothetical protein
MTKTVIDQLVLSFDGTLRIAKAFPAENYDYRPAPDCMTAGEQIEHLAHNLDFVIKPVAAALKIDVVTDQPDTPLERLTWSQKRFVEILSQVPDNEWKREIKYPQGFGLTIREGALLMLEHDGHHRGQLIIYLHLLGIEPPKRWQGA